MFTAALGLLCLSVVKTGFGDDDDDDDDDDEMISD